MRKRFSHLEEPPGAGMPGLAAEPVAGYELVRLLGQGRIVDTYEVYSPQRSCRCVARVLRAECAQDQAARDQVVLEGTMLSELTHPGLVRGYETRYTPVPALVVERLPGVPLEDLAADPSLDHREVARVGVRIAAALGYLHSLGWLHLDLRPSVIVAAPGTESAALTDLGLLGRVGDAETASGPEALVRGRAAPEQTRHKPLQPATDVWGLGATLALALTGGATAGPDPADSSPRSEAAPAPARLPRPRRATGDLADLDLSGLAEGWRDLLSACLSPETGDRPSMEEVRRGLGHLA